MLLLEKNVARKLFKSIHGFAMNKLTISSTTYTKAIFVYLLLVTSLLAVKVN